MTFVWLIVLLVCGRSILKSRKNGGSTLPNISLSNHRKLISAKKRDREFQELIAKIRDNQRRLDSGEDMGESSDPTERMYAREVKELLKPDFHNDPKWQRLSKKVKETLKQTAESNEDTIR